MTRDYISNCREKRQKNSNPSSHHLIAASPFLTRSQLNRAAPTSNSCACSMPYGIRGKRSHGFSPRLQLLGSLCLRSLAPRHFCPQSSCSARLLGAPPPLYLPRQSPDASLPQEGNRRDPRQQLDTGSNTACQALRYTRPPANKQILDGQLTWLHLMQAPAYAPVPHEEGMTKACIHLMHSIL
jgi:hypothetical protein